MKIGIEVIDEIFVNIQIFDDNEEIPENLIEIPYEEWKNVLGSEILWLNNRLTKFTKPPISPNMFKGVFNYKSMEWEETAGLEEQIEICKNIIIEKTKEHELLKASGFTGTQEEINLRIEIENLKQMYMDKNYELALEVENKPREV